MGYLLRTNTGYKHLAKKFERAVLTRVVNLGPVYTIPGSGFPGILDL